MTNHAYRNEQGILVVGSQHVIDALRDDLAMWKERAERAERALKDFETWLLTQNHYSGFELDWGLDGNVVLEKLRVLNGTSEVVMIKKGDAEQDARRYRLLLQFIRYEIDAQEKKEKWLTFAGNRDMRKTIKEAIDAAIGTSESDPAGSPNQPEPPQ